jgi:hypothetical protein
VTHNHPRDTPIAVTDDEVAKAIAVLHLANRNRPLGAPETLGQIGEIMLQRQFRTQNAAAYLAQTLASAFYGPDHPALNEEPQWDASDVRDCLTDVLNLLQGTTPVELATTDADHDATFIPDRPIRESKCIRCGGRIRWEQHADFGQWNDGTSDTAGICRIGGDGLTIPHIPSIGA